MSMPVQKPGKSNQSVQTPPEFIGAVKNLLNIEVFTHDLAADPENTQASTYFTEVDDALSQPWDFSGWVWLNPPYSDIEPWVVKAAVESNMGAHIAALVPASVGAKWWNAHVHGLAQVHFIHPRITFVGHKTPYPKDLALLLYRPNVMGGYSTWRWK